MSGLQQALANEAERNRWMTEEQRRQAAAKRCADLSNEASHHGYVLTDFTVASGANKAFLNAILQLDELAQMVVAWSPKYVAPNTDVCVAARKHILPDPVPTPVERLAKRIWDRPTIGDRLAVGRWLDELGLELVEKKKS